VEPSITAAAKLATHKEPAHRFVAAYHLQQTALHEAQPTLVKLLADPDLQVALQALQGVELTTAGSSPAQKKLQVVTFAALDPIQAYSLGLAS